MQDGLGGRERQVGALRSSSSPEVVMKMVPLLLLCMGNYGGVLEVDMEVCLFMATRV